MSGFNVTARFNQFLAFSTLRSCQKSCATAAITCGSLSQRRSASTDLDFRCGRGAMETHSAHKSPLLVHSCNALAIRLSAAFVLLLRSSVRTASSHSMGFLGFLSRACSSSARALVTFPAASSVAAAAAHRGTHSGHLRRPSVYASRAPAMLPFSSSSWPDISHIFQHSGYLDRPWRSNSFCCSWLPIARSTMAPFIHMRSVPPFSRALARIRRARSGSWFSNSSLKAASQTSSESGLAANASCRMARAAAMSPATHFSFAPMSHNISA
mmetsp:Transcript_9157/g.17131  ORF Transcript_9157/g.17131 Transcript_9157/m.17131 type:complete len:269 (-) Transcript_9157:754-1560(-)